MKNRNYLSYLIYLSLLFLLFGWASGAFGLGQADLSYSQIVDLFESEQVKRFVVQDNQIELELHTALEGKDTITCLLGDPELFRQDLGALIRAQSASGITRMSAPLP